MACVHAQLNVVRVLATSGAGREAMPMARMCRLCAQTTVTVLVFALLSHTGEAQRPIAPGRDLQGMWNANTMTPLQRPPEFAGRIQLAPEEAAEYERSYFERGIARGVNTDIQIDYNDVFVKLPKLDERRTALIVDPPDGQLPPRIPGAAVRAYKRSYDDPEGLSFSERCLTVLGTASTNGNASLASPPLTPAVLFDNLLQIVQTEDRVLIFSEWIHDARVVRLGGTHLPSRIRPWLGDSIGQWDGNTLVIDTTNFRPDTMNWGSTENLHVVERITRSDAGTLRYRVTVEDPATWTRPWTAEWNFHATTEPMIEVACHEGNYNTENFLRGARAEEKAGSGRD